MTRSYRIESMHHVLEVANTLRQSWFRGHAKAVGELVPRVFRSPYAGVFTDFFRPDIELETMERFMRDTPAVSDRALPGPDDYLEWLCLMQHHGSPTRLLDWSEKILVALYFAVSVEPTADGELWAIDPGNANEALTGERGFPLVPVNKKLQFLARQPRSRSNPDALAQSLGLKAPVTSPMAFLHRRDGRRISAQSGAFTIHPAPQPGRQLHELVTSERLLVRYVIPAARKAELFQYLEPLGVNHLSIFQDLDALSKQVCADHNIVAWGPPDPPKCGGLVRDISEPTR